MKFMVFEKVRFEVVVVDEEAGWGFWRLHSFSGSNSGTKRILQEAVRLEGCVCVCAVVVVGVGWWNYTAKSIWPSLSFTAVQFFVPDVMLLLPFWGKRGCSCHFYWRGFIARLNGLKWHLSLSPAPFSFSPLPVSPTRPLTQANQRKCSHLLRARPSLSHPSPMPSSKPNYMRGKK